MALFPPSPPPPLGKPKDEKTGAGATGTGTTGIGATGTGVTGSGIAGTGATGTGRTGAGATGTGTTGAGLTRTPPFGGITGTGATGAGITKTGTTGSGTTGTGLITGAARSGLTGAASSPIGGTATTRPGLTGTGAAGAFGTAAGRPAGTGLFTGAAARMPTSPAAGAAQPTAASTMAAGGIGRALKINNEEFYQLRDFIYEKCGIHIAENRKYLIENRLTNRLKELNLKTFGEYYYYLKFDVNKNSELIKLFEVITTNETSFYRNPPQLQVFQEAVLRPTVETLKKKGSKKLRIWSAGCSTGEEPYTIAMILYEVLGDVVGWDIKITANDLSEAVLTAARKGEYTDYALRTTPQPIIDKYFRKDGARFLVDPKLKRLISFGPVNLSDRFMLRRIERSDIIFCRNVIIYFDDEMKRQIIESFYDNLVPGGCLFIGHSESLHNISRAFKPEHHTGTIVYRKQV